MHNQPLVSILMNCFNGEKYIREAIDSVIEQTYTNWEIIFWDNQSIDSSASIVESYSDVRIKYHYAPTHTLLYEARNYAFAKTSGEFIAFLDVDDLWLPDKLERQIPLFNDLDVGFGCANYWIDDQVKKKWWVACQKPISSGRVLDAQLNNYTVGLLTLIVRRAALPPNRSPFNSRYHIIGDFDLVIRLAAQWKLASIQDPLGVYRMHGNNESAKHRKRGNSELEYWYEEHAADAIVSNSPNFSKIKTLIIYYHGLNALLSGKRSEAFFYFVKMNWSGFKLRLFVALFLPLGIINKIKK
jgi:glycosyltransferase involved in cell wall biosynthesis